MYAAVRTWNLIQQAYGLAWDDTVTWGWSLQYTVANCIQGFGEAGEEMDAANSGDA
jgi:hypothetical protein